MAANGSPASEWMDDVRIMACFGAQRVGQDEEGDFEDGGDGGTKEAYEAVILTFFKCVSAF